MENPNKLKSVEIPQNVHRAAKVAAAAEGRRLADVVVDAISAYVAARLPQLRDHLASPRSSGKPKNPRNPKPPCQPPATTGPGSVGYVAPTPPAYEESLSEPLPVAGADENPFTDDVGEDLLPDRGG